MSVLVAGVLLVQGCAMQDVTDSATAVGKKVKDSFYRYTYYSLLDRRRADDWVPNEMPEGLPPKKKENWENYKIGNPYEIDGRWYYPKEEPDYREVGVASWYGEEFHNKLTGNGEIYDMHGISAAHRTLPMPSVVRVTNLENGRSLLVRVNDRGPFAKDRIIDLSVGAAKKLGMYEKGTARVKVELDGVETANLFYDAPDDIFPAKPFPRIAKHRTSPKAHTYARAGKNENALFYVQTGAYSSRDGAARVEHHLKDISHVQIEETLHRNQTLYRVRLGPFKSKRHAGEALERVAAIGFSDAIIIYN